MSDNWIVEILQNALTTWNNKLAEIWTLLSTSPEAFKGGAVWGVIQSIHSGLKAIGYGLLVLFFVIGVVKTCGSFTEIKRPEVAVKMFVRFALAEAAITYGMELLMAVLSICQGVISKIMTSSGISGQSALSLPGTMITVIESVGFLDSIPLWIVALLSSLLITVLSFVVVLTVYSRFFKLYFHAAIAPVALASFAGQPSQSIGISFLKSYTGVCLEGAIIVLACVIFSVFATSAPAVSGTTAVNMVWSYIGELVFNLLVLVGAVRLADTTVKQMLGLYGGNLFGSQDKQRNQGLSGKHVFRIVFEAMHIFPAGGRNRCGNLFRLTGCGRRHGRGLDLHPRRRTLRRMRFRTLSRADGGAVRSGVVQKRVPHAGAARLHT